MASLGMPVRGASVSPEDSLSEWRAPPFSIPAAQLLLQLAIPETVLCEGHSWAIPPAFRGL